MRYLPIKKVTTYYSQIVFLKDLPILQIHLLIMQLEQQGEAKTNNRSLLIWLMKETKKLFQYRFLQFMK